MSSTSDALPQHSRSELFEAMVVADDLAAQHIAEVEYMNALTRDVEEERRRRAGAPRMALRPHNIEDWPGLDDIVVEHPIRRLLGQEAQATRGVRGGDAGRMGGHRQGTRKCLSASPDGGTASAASGVGSDRACGLMPASAPGRSTFPVPATGAMAMVRAGRFTSSALRGATATATPCGRST